jgi:hypothetical protein
MSFTDRDRTSDGFGGRSSRPADDLSFEQPYGERSLGATTDAAVQRDAGGLRVQLRADEGEASETVHAAAEHGLSGASQTLPHADAIQRAFGRHDVGGVDAHVGGAAAEGAAAMGATAFASGNHVAFAGAPDLHTAAHEAAHVVQQRAGVQLKGGVGAEGDAYERHADAVADRVVAGQSAESLLDGMAGSSRSSSSGGVQRAVQMERFIGVPAKHHLHVDIGQEHYKFGTDRGSRMDFGGNGNHRLDALKEARNYLVDNGFLANGGRECIAWLETACRDHNDWDEQKGFKTSYEKVEAPNPHVDNILGKASAIGLEHDDFSEAFAKAKEKVMEKEAKRASDHDEYSEDAYNYRDGTTVQDLQDELDSLKLKDILARWHGFDHVNEFDAKTVKKQFKAAAIELMQSHLEDEFPPSTGKRDHVGMHKGHSGH